MLEHRDLRFNQLIYNDNNALNDLYQSTNGSNWINKWISLSGCCCDCYKQNNQFSTDCYGVYCESLQIIGLYNFLFS